MIFKFKIYANETDFKKDKVGAVVTFDTIDEDDNLLEGETFIAGSNARLVKELTELINDNPDKIPLRYFPFWNGDQPKPNPKNWFWTTAILLTVGYLESFLWRVQPVSGPSGKVVQKFIESDFDLRKDTL